LTARHLSWQSVRVFHSAFAGLFSFAGPTEDKRAERTEDRRHGNEPLGKAAFRLPCPLDNRLEPNYGDIPGEALAEIAAEVWAQDDRQAAPTRHF